MKKLPKEQIQHMAVALLFAFLFAFAYYRYFFKPMLSGLREKREKIEVLGNRVEELEKRANKLDKLKEELATAQVSWEGLKSRLPDKRDLPGIIETITQVTRKHQLTLASIAPKEPKAADLYEEFPFGITVAGSYHDIAHFLVAIGNLERIYRAENLALSPAAPTPESPNASAGAAMTLITYKYRGN